MIMLLLNRHQPFPADISDSHDFSIGQQRKIPDVIGSPVAAANNADTNLFWQARNLRYAPLNDNPKSEWIVYQASGDQQPVIESKPGIPFQT
jgi:hypothetical protein